MNIIKILMHENPFSSLNLRRHHYGFDLRSHSKKICFVSLKYMDITHQIPFKLLFLKLHVIINMGNSTIGPQHARFLLNLPIVLEK